MKEPIAIGALFFVSCQLSIFAAEAFNPAVAQDSLLFLQDNSSAAPVKNQTAGRADQGDAQDSLLFLQDKSSAAPVEHQMAGRADQSASVLVRSSSLQIGGNYTWASIHPRGHTTFHGSLGGMQALYEYLPLDSFYGGIKATWREGTTHGHAGKRSLLYIDVHERFGYTFSFSHGNVPFTLYTGFGYRHYGQKFDPEEGSSLKFRYNEFYIPVGTKVGFVINSHFTFGFNVTWMPQVYPTVTIDPMKGARWKITTELANFYAEMPFTFTLTKNQRFFLVINPFYEYWRDGHTTAKTETGLKLDVPRNTYNFAGVEVNFGYFF